MKFSHRLVLKNDLPTYKKGWTFRWCGKTQRYYPEKPSQWEYDKGKPSIYLDFSHQGYKLDEVQDEEWFEHGELTDFHPEFPSVESIEDFVYLNPETRLVKDDDFCRCFDELLESEGFYRKLYNFYRNEYNKKFNLTK